MPHMVEDVRQHVELLAHLHDLVSEHPDFEVLCEPTAAFYCFRYLPNGLATDERKAQQQLNHLNGEIVERVQHEGFALVNKTEVDNRVAIRFSICSYRTVREDIDSAFEAIARCGRLLTRKKLSSLGNAREIWSQRNV
jgi:glutamate/tyrosine decarboxylase-like PLP-dependent enzyme